MRRSLLYILVVVLLLGVYSVYAAQIDLNQVVTGSYDLSAGSFTEDTSTSSYGGVTVDMIRQEIALLDPNPNDSIVPAVDLSLAAVGDTAFRVVSGSDELVKVGDPGVIMVDADFGIIRGGTISLDNIVIYGNRSIIADDNATVVLYAVESASELAGSVVLQDSSNSPKVYTTSFQAGQKIQITISGGPHDVYVFFPGHAYTSSAINKASYNKWQPVYAEWVKDPGKGVKIWYPNKQVTFTAPSDGQYTIIVVKYTGVVSKDNSFSIKILLVGSGSGSGGSNNTESSPPPKSDTGSGSQVLNNKLILYALAGIGAIIVIVLVFGAGAGRRGVVGIVTLLLILIPLAGVAILGWLYPQYLMYLLLGFGLIILLVFLATVRGIGMGRRR